ncbi:FAD-binding oxidoreductase [Gordonia rhizosphera]|uniref:Putative FAD-linked oxidase n=1 Tax=Gordonia rhizosphera NBRC 16068 TaxID=1108045 RepID=K6V4W0_9ACTN|nr:FAD-binding oxidoreductase [Gordonia rhizosphera]GAB91223.1 putative FAD-linked oxidase [Gordonia rhizosphera NBRC 16068]
MSSRSWWGWGTDENALSPAETDALVNRVAALIPDHDFTDHPPPAPQSLPVPPPRISVPATLSAVFSDDVRDRLSHARGKAFRDVVRNLHGDISHVPDLVARPRTERDVIDILDFCSAEALACIPYGGGSSVVGGVEPRFDGPAVTLDLGRLDRVVEIDDVTRSARIQAGALGPHIEDQLRPAGLTLRHFPQSFEFSSLGGWLATRAGGHFATLYTHIDDLTESIRAITPAGVSESRRLPSSGAGPSPDRLLLGSEGTLGVITEAWMRLQDRPRFGTTVSVGFDDYHDAVRATRTVAQSGLYPSNCRLLDPAEAFINAGAESPGGVLILAFESADHPVGPWIDRAVEIATDHAGHVLSQRDRGERDNTGNHASAAWRSAFIRMPYQRDALARRSMIVETFETACTWDHFDALHIAVTAVATDTVQRICGAGVVTCRFTHVYPDGPASYYSIYAPGRWGSTVAQWDEIKSAVSEAISNNHGTITHHHAVGRDHRSWYDTERPDLFAAALTAAKHVLDPAGILNPGVLVG